MKKYFLIFNLFLIVCATWSQTAFAKKRYRYIKREHGLRLQGNIHTHFDSGFSLSTNINGAYTYNWKGMIEAGPYLQLQPNVERGTLSLNQLAGGLIFEYNFVKNQGKRMLIPALGMQFGAEKSPSAMLRFGGGVHGTLKVFVGTRTPFTVTLAYNLLTSLQQPIQLSHNIDVSMGFSYYFDFY